MKHRAMLRDCFVFFTITFVMSTKGFASEAAHYPEMLCQFPHRSLNLLPSEEEWRFEGAYLLLSGPIERTVNPDNPIGYYTDGMGWVHWIWDSGLGEPETKDFNGNYSATTNTSAATNANTSELQTTVSLRFYPRSVELFIRYNPLIRAQLLGSEGEKIGADSCMPNPAFPDGYE